MNFMKFRLMNAAGDNGDGGSGQSQTDGEGTQTDSDNLDPKALKAELEKLRGEVDSFKTKATQVESNREQILREKRELEKELKSLKANKLEEKGEFKTLWEAEKQHASDLQKALDDIKKEESDRKAAIFHEERMEQAYKALGGRDKFFDLEDIKRGNIEKVVMDPETGKWSEVALKQFADDFRSRFPHYLKSSDGDTPRDSGKQIVKAGGEYTAEELAAMPYEKRLKLAFKDVKNGLNDE